MPLAHHSALLVEPDAAEPIKCAEMEYVPDAHQILLYVEDVAAQWERFAVVEGAYVQLPEDVVSHAADQDNSVILISIDVSTGVLLIKQSVLDDAAEIINNAPMVFVSTVPIIWPPVTVPAVELTRNVVTKGVYVGQ